MIIRCERCSTLYELDETRLAPEGSQVQCARCEAVFTARPPTPGGAPSSQAAPSSAATSAAEPPPAPPHGARRPVDSARPAHAGPNIYRRPQPAPSAPPPPATPARARPGGTGP